MRTQKLTLTDCPDAARLHQLSFYKGWSEKDFEEFLADPLTQGLKSEEGGKLCGYILWREIGEEAEILTLVVAPDFQRRGLGSHLLDALFQRLGEQGVSTLFIEVAEDNEGAHLFYLKQGFNLISKRPNYYQREENKYVSAWNYIKKL